jgi:hypothetical protein
MVEASRKYFYGDTLIIFGREDQNFQWSREYSYYSSPPAQKDVIWASRIDSVGVSLRYLTIKNFFHGALKSMY